MEAQNEKLQFIASVYEQDYKAAKSRTQKLDLSKKLLKAGVETHDDLTGRYVLFRIARDIAIQNGDLVTTVEAIEQIDQWYQIDAIALMVESAERTLPMAMASDARRTAVAVLWSLIDKAVAVNRYEEAVALAKLELDCLINLNDKLGIERAEAKLRQVEQMGPAYEQTKASLELMETRPTDPIANLAVGKFLCFYKGDWRFGVLYFALCSEASYKEVAMLELTQPADPLIIGDRWWDLADKETEAIQTSIKAHAATWYQQSLPNLSGLTKTRVEKRLEEIGVTHDAIDVGKKKVARLGEDLLNRVKSGIKPGSLWLPSLNGLEARVENTLAEVTLLSEPPAEYDLICSLTIAEVSLGHQEFRDTTINIPWRSKGIPFTIRRKSGAVVGSFWSPFNSPFGANPTLGTHLGSGAREIKIELTFVVRESGISVSVGTQNRVEIDGRANVKNSLPNEISISTNTPTVFHSVMIKPSTKK